MLRLLMLGMVIAISAIVSGAAGTFVGARMATTGQGWFNGARDTVHGALNSATPDANYAPEGADESAIQGLPAERDTQAPAHVRWAASERGRWTDPGANHRNPVRDVRNTRYEDDDRWNDEPQRRSARREPARDERARDRRFRDDDRRSRDRRDDPRDMDRYDDRRDRDRDRYRYDIRDDIRDDDRRNRDRDRPDRNEREQVRERIEVVVRTEAAEPTARQAGPAPAPPTAPAPASPPAPPTVLASHTGHLPAAMAAPVVIPAPEPEPEMIEITVPAGTTIEVNLAVSISTETARIEDRVDGTVSRSVSIDGHTVIPAGAQVQGTVSNTDDGGRLKGAARLAVRFHQLILEDGTVMRFSSRSFERVGPSPGRTTATRTGGGAAVGALIGGLFGGERGAAIGGSIGAAGGAASSAGRARPVMMRTGTSIPVTFTHPARVIIEA